MIFRKLFYFYTKLLGYIWLIVLLKHLTLGLNWMLLNPFHFSQFAILFSIMASQCFFSEGISGFFSLTDCESQITTLMKWKHEKFVVVWWWENLIKISSRAILSINKQPLCFWCLCCLFNTSILGQMEMN